MKKVLLFAMSAALLALCSCRTGTTVTGQSCYELSESEKAQLVTLARASLRKSNHIVTASETPKVMEEQPEFRIRYTGDKSGEAKLTWTFPKKKVSIVFVGEFLAKDARWRAEIQPVYDEVIINRPKK